MKPLLNETQWRKLARLRDRLVGKISLFLSGILLMMPLRVLAATKERLVVKAKMDYPREDIYLAVDTVFEVSNRLNACRKEPETIRWIESFIKPGDVVYDVGANVGAYSLIIDRATQHKAIIYSFEPVFTTFSQLCRNIYLNGCHGKIIPLQIALTSTSGLVTLNYSSVDPGSAFHVIGSIDATIGFAPIFAQPVLGYRIDDLINFLGIEKPNHIKLDTDGGEIDVLRGAERTLTDPSVKSILVEINSGHEPSNDVMNLLTTMGFTIHSKHAHGGNGVSISNYIFVRYV